MANMMDRKYDFSASVLSLGLIPDPLKKTKALILPITIGLTSDAPLPAKRGTWERRRMRHEVYVERASMSCHDDSLLELRDSLWSEEKEGATAALLSTATPVSCAMKAGRGSTDEIGLESRMSSSRLLIHLKLNT